ncbi:retrovirus-related pol polyprotein from transposon TNT 1-94 [Tanacetum coccineum]
MALGTKLKLGFIDGSYLKPVTDHEDVQRWIRCDYIVTCWILNSMVTELSKAFLYAQCACELWKEIGERYGQSNGPLIFQLERELSKINQGNLTIASFFNKLKKCWDELENLNGIPTCDCGKMRECTCNVLEKFMLRDTNSKLIQFLMKLNDGYESVRSKKAKKTGRIAAQVNSGFDEHFNGDSPFDMGYENEVGMNQGGTVDSKLVEDVCQEMMKLFKGKGIIEDKGSESTSHAVTKPHKDKFDNRGVKCILLRFSLNQKGYKVFNLESKELPNDDQTTPLPPTDAVPNTPIHFSPISSETTPPRFSPQASPVTSNTSSSIYEDIQVPTRKFTRQSGKPAWLKDFVIPSAAKTDPHYPLFVSSYFKGLLESHVAFLVNAFTSPDPTRYHQAVKHSGWVQAMNKELEALERNNTCSLTALPPGHNSISSKWVFKTKFNPNGSTERLKARLVVRGFNQKEGVDYKHTFSHVAKLATVRVLIAIATAKQWPLHQLDINNAFLHGYIDEEIYMTPPEGVGYEQSKHDYSLFVKQANGTFTAALVYVDDVLITGDSLAEILSLKAGLDHKFTIKDLGLDKYFLGIEICRTKEGTHLNQRKYILDLLTDVGLTAAKPNSSPLPTKLKLSLTKAPKDAHLQAAIHLLKYLKGTVSKGLFYLVQPHLKITRFSDADWDSCLMTRKSLTGYCIFLGHSLVSWKTKKQATVGSVIW